MKQLKQKSALVNKVQSFALDNAIPLSLFALIVVIIIIEPAFLSVNVLRDLLLQNSTRLIIALGMSFVLISGGVDLSGGRVVGLAAVISASLGQTAGYVRKFYPDLVELPVIVPIIAAMAACALVGALNGTLIARFGLPAFIATLATQLGVYGMNSLYFDMSPNNSQPIGGLTNDFKFLGTGYIGSIPMIVIIALVVAVIVWVIQNKTIFGRNVFAIGGNQDAAYVAGIKVVGTLVIVYALASALFGLGGVLEAARTGGGTSNYGNAYELDAIAACVVGGVSNTGGIGTVFGVIIGVFLFGIINYGLTFIGVSPYWQLIVKGLIIGFAVGFDIKKRSK